ncbi:uncharacterized protein LOC123651277 [Pipistrellus kuhlii]|uniref:uncharacterized protein LOC123651277 n=1 Tax=Pipistrellus kuhlii TaxID=59472 RepID=UPI001E270E29|nr:uncharacterized protein LOC123651277 [Pipistrellus kuhlii]
MGISSQHYPSGSVFKSGAGSLFGFLLLLLHSSLNYAPLPKGGRAVIPPCAVWKSGRASLVMNRYELLKMPVCVPAQAFSFPSPTASLSQAPSLPISPPTPYPLPPCLSSAVNQAEAHSCFARLSVKDVLWLLFGLQHAELQLFRGDSLQLLLKLLIFFPSLLPLLPTLIGLKTLFPEFALLPWHYVYGKPDTMAVSGTGQTTAACSPYSKDLKGDCTAGNASEQHHREPRD